MASVDCTCIHCGVAFQVPAAWAKRGEGRYCSIICSGAYRRAHPKPKTVYAPLTQARLKELLHYDPETGLFTWLVKSSNGKVKVGDLASTSLYLGYRRVKINRVAYFAHRLAFLYMTGEWPKGDDVDHKNEVRHDNRWDNLRDVPRHMNLQNRTKANSRSTSGLLGAHWNERVGCYQSAIRCSGKQHFLGLFTTAEEAHAAYVEAKRRLHDGFLEPLPVPN